MWYIFRIAALFLVLSVPIAQVHAGPVEEFFKDKTIQWVVPYRPGGGYDQYSRLLAPFIEKYSGASVQIVNIEGAGGMKGAVEIYRSPPDGLHLGIVNGPALVGNEIAGTVAVDYEFAKFSYLARIAAEERVMVTGADSSITETEDLLVQGVIVGSTGIGGSSHVDAVIANIAIGAGWRVIPGFDSSSDLRLAILRGDIDGMWGSYGSAVEGIAAGDLVVVLRAGVLPLEGIADVPTVSEYADEKEELVAAWRALAEIGRPLVGPPNIPEDRLTFLRQVMRDAIADPNFQEQAKSSKRQINYLSGQEIGARTKKASEMSDTTLNLLAATLKGES